ncbi:MAG: restriction endonuclease subunit S [Geobacteraceae bacterium]
MSKQPTKLRDICDVITKGTTPTTMGFEFVDKGIGFLRVQNIYGGTVNYKHDTLYIDEKTHQAFSRSQIYPGDVLVSIAGTIGRVGVVPEDAPILNCNQAVAIVRTNGEIFRPYLRHWLESSDAQRQMRGSTVTGTISNLSLSQVGNLQIPLPPLDEQRCIAAILDKADAIRRKRQESIRLTEAFLRSTFLEMFGDPVTNPKGLKTGLLGDYCDMETGYAFKSEAFQVAGIKLCRGANVMPGEIEWSDVKYWSNDSQIAERYVLREGDVVLAMDRPWISSGLKVARVSNSDLPSYLVQRVARLRGIKGLSNEYIYFCIKHLSFTKHCKPKITETTIPHISPLDIRSHQILIPDAISVETFSKIAVNVLQTEIKLQNQTHNTEDLFNSLTHRAFRGEL